MKNNPAVARVLHIAFVAKCEKLESGETFNL